MMPWLARPDHADHGSVVTNRASGLSSGIFVHELYRFTRHLEHTIEFQVIVVAGDVDWGL